MPIKFSFQAPRSGKINVPMVHPLIQSRGAGSAAPSVDGMGRASAPPVTFPNIFPAVFLILHISSKSSGKANIYIYSKLWNTHQGHFFFGVFQRSAKKKMSGAQESSVYIVSVRWSTCKSVDEASLIAKRPELHSWFKRECEKFVYQLERGEETHVLHYQGWLNLKRKQRPKALASSVNHLFYGINISHASNEGKVALKSYCMKVDTRVDGPWTHEGRLVAYQGADLPSLLYPWQQYFAQLFEGKADDRTIHWLVDPEGSHGKSKFTKYCEFKEIACSLAYAHAHDLINLVFKRGKRNAYVVDLTRTKPALVSAMDLYAALESVKNGHITNTKYETGVHLFDPPHVLVLANTPPVRSALTSDRFRLWHLAPDLSLVLGLPRPPGSLEGCELDYEPEPDP